jgi:hypothetical protein
MFRALRLLPWIGWGSATLRIREFYRLVMEYEGKVPWPDENLEISLVNSCRRRYDHETCQETAAQTSPS